MWIKVSDDIRSESVTNTEQIVKMFITKAGRDKNWLICEITTNDNKPFMIGEYEKLRTAQSAFDLMIEAIENGEDFFEMPHDGDPRLSYSDGVTNGGGLSYRQGKTNGKTK